MVLLIHFVLVLSYIYDLLNSNVPCFDLSLVFSRNIPEEKVVLQYQSISKYGEVIG